VPDALKVPGSLLVGAIRLPRPTRIDGFLGSVCHVRLPVIRRPASRDVISPVEVGYCTPPSCPGIATPPTARRVDGSHRRTSGPARGPLSASLPHRASPA